MESIRNPVPPFTLETALAKVQIAEDAWNSKDPVKISKAYTIDSKWRNRDLIFQGREKIVDFLTKKWEKENGYRLVKTLWCYEGNRIAVRFQYEWHDEEGQWYRSEGNENWQFDNLGYMEERWASINDIPIKKEERTIAKDP